ncbi:hypothetical protein [Streptomyces bobili]|uniref:hypothetical protein n=1 Tax=Streptomyces bobili TaxID=67280 RepID=UPI003801C7A0
MEVQVFNAWWARPSGRLPEPLAALRHPWYVKSRLPRCCSRGRREIITDTLVELLNLTVRCINARAEKEVTAASVADFTRVCSKSGLLGKMAAVPPATAWSVVRPAADGEKTRRDVAVGSLELYLGQGALPAEDELMPGSGSQETEDGTQVPTGPGGSG